MQQSVYLSNPKTKIALKALFASPVVQALVVLIVANLLLLQISPLAKVDPESLPSVRSWVWWAAQDYKQQKTPANVVVLGSSLMMQCTWFQEAQYRQKEVDLVVDHRMHYFESILREKAGLSKVSCFNLALPGCMVSDDYMIIKALLSGAVKPDVLVIGLGARDLVDNKFNCAASSNIYKYLNRFVDTKEQLELAMPQLWQRLGYQAERLVYFKTHSNDARILCSVETLRLAQPLIKGLPPSRLNSTSEADRRVASYQSEIQKGVWVAKPNVPDGYFDMNDDCLKRFRTPNDTLFANQKKWLELCLETCKEQNIDVVLVDVPFSPTARQLVHPGIHERHLSTLREFAKKWNCALVELDDPDKFDLTDFTDYAHLDASGGKKMLNAISEQIAAKKNLVARLQVASDRPAIAADDDNI